MFFKLIIKIKKRVLYWLNIISNRIVTIGFIIGYPGTILKKKMMYRTMLFMLHVLFFANILISYCL